MDKITGIVTRRVFYDQSTGYAVVRIAPDKVGADTPKIITIVGQIGALKIDDFVSVTGKWEEHKLHGHRFVVDTLEFVPEAYKTK